MSSLTIQGFGLDLYGLESWGSVGAPTILSGPVVTNISPSIGSLLNGASILYFDVVTSNPGLNVVISAQFEEVPGWDLVFDGSVYSPMYHTGDTTLTSLSDGWRFQFARGTQWPVGGLTIKVVATDAYGNRTVTELGYTVQAVLSVVVPALPDVRSKNVRYGVLLPFRRTSLRDFAAGSGMDLIRSELMQVLMTAPGEIPWRPGFGTRLGVLRHLRNTAALTEIARNEIEQAVSRWVPAVKVVGVTAEPFDFNNRNTIKLTLIYRIGTNEPEKVSLAL